MKCILQVEDDENDIFLLRHAFTRAGITHPLHTVTNGQQAMDYLSGVPPYDDRRLYPLPCLVLLDLKLPLVSGLEVLKWIRAQSALRTLIVIAFTSSANPHDVECAYHLGVNAFVVKPPDAHRRLEFARMLHGWWLTFTQLPTHYPERH
jgi:CheY-like chemotaxis protein